MLLPSRSYHNLWKSYRLIGMVFIFELLIKVFASTNSFQIKIAFIVITVIIVFFDIGITIAPNTLNILPPSIIADSRISPGINL